MKHDLNVKKHMILQICLFVFLIAIDQFSKLSLAGLLQDNEKRTLIPGVIELKYLENTGAAFGIFRDRQWIFYILSALILAVIIYVFVKLYRRLHEISGSSNSNNTARKAIWLGYGLAVLGAGAVGNLIDRIAHGYVIDFIHVTFIEFPVFNLADIYVTISCIFIVVFFLFIYKKDDNFKLF